MGFNQEYMETLRTIEEILQCKQTRREVQLIFALEGMEDLVKLLKEELNNMREEIC